MTNEQQVLSECRNTIRAAIDAYQKAVQVHDSTQAMIGLVEDFDKVTRLWLEQSWESGESLCQRVNHILEATQP